jgi:hypothetical protein
LTLPRWLPDDRTLNAALLVVLSLVIAVYAGRARQLTAIPAAPVVAVASAPALNVAPTTVVQDSSLSAPGPAPTAAPTVPPAVNPVTASPDALANAAFAQAPALAADPPAQVVAPPSDGPLLPNYRVVTFYGHPHDPNMGIVGEYSMDEIAQKVKAEAANYAAADPTRPVVAAFELIATVAQRVPGADGTYILDTDRDTLNSYIDYAAQNGMLVVLDLQVGRGTVADEIEKVRDLLAKPNVHLAIDPEFAVAEGQVPGEYIGSIPADSITYAQQVLADISASNNIPPKLLIVHQFREDMIQGKETLAPYPGVQLVIDSDGYGAPELKTAVYNFIVRDAPIEYAGVKVFYKQDVPLMSPQDLLALVPAPDVIIYQ